MYPAVTSAPARRREAPRFAGGRRSAVRP